MYKSGSKCKEKRRTCANQGQSARRKKGALQVRNKDYITLLTQHKCRAKDADWTFNMITNAKQRKLNKK